MTFAFDVGVVGGCGRVGLPLGIAFAQRGLKVALYDIDRDAVEVVSRGSLPFREVGAADLLREAIDEGRLVASSDASILAGAANVIVTLATDVDVHMNPDTAGFLQAMGDLARLLVDGQLLILRSTVYPGVTRLVEQIIAEHGRSVEVACCPERIAEGQAMTELFELPQIVGARSPETHARAERLFRALTSVVVPVEPEEAELAKLFTNTWRYAKFAVANQLFMIANDFGQDYERIRAAMTLSYPRAADLPRAGFAAGPCLFKDTLQLAAFNNYNFTLGHASTTVNEGLPLYVVSRLAQTYELASMTVGILGMAFKAGSDDTRSSLSYKLKHVLRVKTREVLCTDPFVTDDAALLPLDEVLERADLLIIGAPHGEYASIVTDRPIVDIWNLRGMGVRV